jgi:hypothetical protein
MFGTGNDGSTQPSDNNQPATQPDVATDQAIGNLPEPVTTTDYGSPMGSSVDSTASPAAATTASNDALLSSANGDELLTIKQQALQQLSPLVGHLEQSPEEKFRTTMMLIQASDNADLIKDAYTAAQAITDEKVRAQALLDIVNEINYFTQHHEQ